MCNCCAFCSICTHHQGGGKQFPSPDPLAQIAESLTRLADIAELKLRDGWISATDTQTIKEIIAKYPRVVISPKVGEDK